VRTFLEDRGFGFISLDENRKSLFFHQKNYPLTIPRNGQCVVFDVTEDRQGRAQAVNIRLANDEK
jgi:cold shock CspA family protein